MIVDQAVVGGRTGTFYVSFAPLDSDVSPQDNFTNYEDRLVANASFSYSIRSNTAGCYYYDEELEKLSSEGCLVSHECYGVNL